MKGIIEGKELVVEEFGGFLSGHKTDLGAMNSIGRKPPPRGTQPLLLHSLQTTLMKFPSHA